MTAESQRSARAGVRRLHALEQLRCAADASSIRRARAAARAELGRDRRDTEMRLALAEHYRAHGARSQAGRWGITTDGWATPAEVRELRHWLLGFARDSDFIRGSLLLDADQALPDEVSDLVEPSLRAPRDVPPSPGQSGCWWFLVAVVSMIVAAVCGVILMIKAFNDDPDLFAAAQTLCAVGGLAGVIAVAAFLTGRWDERRAERRMLRYQPRGEIDPAFAVRLALRLAEEGDRRGGEILLRSRLRRTGDVEARRVLLLWAREAGRSDQAGRWGAPLDGATTAEERQAFAASLGSFERAARLRRARDMSEARTRTSLDMRDVVRRAGGASSREEALFVALSLTWWIAVVALIVLGCTVTAVLALQSDAAAVLATRWSVTIVLVMVGALMACALWERPRMGWSSYGAALAGLGMMLIGGWMGWMLATDSWAR